MIRIKSNVNLNQIHGNAWIANTHTRPHEYARLHFEFKISEPMCMLAQRCILSVYMRQSIALSFSLALKKLFFYLRPLRCVCLSLSPFPSCFRSGALVLISCDSVDFSLCWQTKILYWSRFCIMRQLNLKALQMCTRIECKTNSHVLFWENNED